MNENVDNSNNIMTNFKSLAKSISSAQSNIFRCKSTLKCIEEELIYLNVNSNTNTNNRDFRKVPIITETLDHSQAPESMVEIDAELPKTMNFLTRHSVGDLGNRVVKSRNYPKISITQTPDNHTSSFVKNTNSSNINCELNNLMKAQHKLICQIDQLKCEIRDKACSIDVCVKDNQYFNCKFKEIECDIDMLKREVDKIKKDQAIPSTRDRGFSPYSQDSCQKEMLNIPTSLRHSNDKVHEYEKHFGYQDVCTPDNSLITGPMLSKTNRNLLVNFRDPQCNSKTFEDLLKKNKLDIDCNINNCRNNQNMFSLIPSVQPNPVLQDFACLTNQIKSLRKMAEAIFKGNYQNIIKKTNAVNHQCELILKASDTAQDDQSKSSISKPNAEITLSMLNQQSRLKTSALINSLNCTKTDSSSESTSMSSNDTTGCIYTEDQLPIHSPTTNSNYNRNNDAHHSNLGGNIFEERKPLRCVKQSTKENHQTINRKHKGNENKLRKQEINVGYDSLGQQCTRSYEPCNCRMVKKIINNKPLCHQCNQYLSNILNI